ncbi:Invasion associated locus B family protein [Parvibaculum lavamentivorans DS-1]|uniref:Invasion associated locus B family protein n=1 Tax=Parvibaculum lavamentivorans (strain DS-1 / DSM 13023 / NCIMB 13966) TaxID=402881 RepID=A7HXR8_PARL1|nr:invasion associated locus B family protein [Parvibaculum lavamentivorans]ABS64701.1 Invasion associated locus B family protein [Parvibaculum lavamentivorans DS-1]
MSIRRLITGVAAALMSVAGLIPANAQGAAGAEKSDAKIETFGTWSTRCEKNEAGAEHCHAFVDIRIGEEKQRIAYLGIGYGPRDGNEDGKQDMFMFAITPLGTFLPAGIGWSIDGAEPFGQHFMYCLPGGCQTEILLDDARLKALKGGKEMVMSFRIVGQGDAKVPVKLDGISKAIAAVPVPKKS